METSPDNKVMKGLASAIKTHHAVLFVGAGATRDGGGASWGELAEHVVKELKVSGEPTPQETFDELCDYQRRKVDVYDLIQSRLSEVKAPKGLAALLGLRWLTVLTTNYDTAIEDFYRESGLVRPKVMFGAERAVQFGIPGEVLIFKVMGSRSARPGEQGEMVISSVDRKRHQREESEIYDHLDEIVSAQVVLAVGYSFSDRILLEAVQQVRSLNVQSGLSIFAVFKPGVKNPIVEKLRKLGVQVIEMEFEQFCQEIASLVGKTTDDESLRIRFQGRAVFMNPHSIRDALYNFDLVKEDDCKRPIPYGDFLRGSTSWIGAYEAGLQWVRNAINSGRAIIDDWYGNRKQPYLIINLVGRPGSGRTVVSNDLLHYSVTKYPSIGLKAPQRSPRLDDVAAAQIMTHLRESVAKEPPAFLTVLTDEHSSFSDVLTFVHQADPAGNGVVVIRSAEKRPDESPFALTLNNSPTVAVHEIELSDTIDENEISSLSDYVNRLPLDIRPRGLNRDDIKHVANQDPSFIEMMYRLVDPARRSITDIVLEKFAELEAPARALTDLLLIGSASGIEIPLTLLAKAQDQGYPQLYATLDRCRNLVRIREDGVSIPYVSLYHRRVAEILGSVPANRERGLQGLNRLVDLANLKSGPEHQLIADLLVGKPFLPAPVEGWLSDQQILGLFSRVRSAGASRLLLHHYGLRLRKSRNLDESINVLKEAINVPEDLYRPTERREIVATTLAQTRWFQLKEIAPDCREDDPRIGEIREELRQARARSRWNPHSYAIEATILKELAGRCEGSRKMNLLSEAMGLLREGLAASAGTEARLIEGIKEIADLSKGFTVQDAGELFDKFGSGHGYFLLYERAVNNDSGKLANDLLDKAVQSKVPCPPALRARIDREFEMPSPNYDLARGMSDRLFDYNAASPRLAPLTWNDHLQRVVSYIGSGNGRLVLSSIAEVRRTGPRYILQPYPYFLRSQGARAEFRGSVEELGSATVGTIGSHNITGFSSPVFFNPARGKTPTRFRLGDRVKFNLAFGVHGLTAWDVVLD